MDDQSGVARASEDPCAELARRIMAGDALGESELVDRYRRGLLVIATVRTRDREAAQDLAQEILMAVIQALRVERLQDPEKLTAFVYGTARNLINNYLKTKVRHGETDIETVEEPSTDPVQELELAERQRLVRRELEKFSLLDQQILLLSLVDGHTLLEVADRLRMSHEAVRARRSRMIRKITKRLGPMSHK